MEFSNREIRRAQGPYSLVWLRRSLQGWLHNAKPWETLLFVSVFNTVKERIAKNPRYFEELIQRYLLDNQHRALVIVEPEQGFLEKQEAELVQQLAEKKASLSQDELKNIRKKTSELARIQEAKEKAEDLLAIPHLSLSDLSPDISRIPREIYDTSGIPVVSHDLFTNGITYINLAFPVDTLAPEDYSWLSLFARALVSVGLPGMDYAHVSSLLARTVGDFSPLLKSNTLAPGASSSIVTSSGIFDLGGRDWIIYNLEALDEKTVSGLDIALDLITKADFSDLRRLKDIVLSFKNDGDSSLAPAGHSYAACRANCSFSRFSAVDEIWNGIFQLEFSHRIAEMDITEISFTLTRIRDTLASAGMLVNLTGSKKAIHTGLRFLGEKFGRFGPPKPRNPLSLEAAPFFNMVGASQDGSLKPEVFASPSLQVGFASAGIASSQYASKEYAAEMALSHYLSTGSLWESIRMKGGAYGAFAYLNGLDRIFSLSTYRDPDPLRSLSTFTDVLKKSGGHKLDAETLVKVIIGVYSKETRPQTPSQKGFVDILRFLYGIEDQHRVRVRRNLLDISAEQIAQAAKHVSSAYSASCILAGTAVAEKAAAKLGVEVKTLSV
jgi:Zn-dependent M16 (insulinase) family peptidase